MSQKNATNGNAAIKHDDAETRVTSARSLYRHLLKTQKISLVKPELDDLLSKEYECCAIATD